MYRELVGSVVDHEIIRECVMHNSHWSLLDKWGITDWPADPTELFKFAIHQNYDDLSRFLMKKYNHLFIKAVKDMPGDETINLQNKIIECVFTMKDTRIPEDERLKQLLQLIKLHDDSDRFKEKASNSPITNEYFAFYEVDLISLIDREYFKEYNEIFNIILFRLYGPKLDPAYGYEKYGYEIIDYFKERFILHNGPVKQVVLGKFLEYIENDNMAMIKQYSHHLHAIWQYQLIKKCFDTGNLEAYNFINKLLEQPTPNHLFIAAVDANDQEFIDIFNAEYWALSMQYNEELPGYVREAITIAEANRRLGTSQQQIEKWRFFTHRAQNLALGSNKNNTAYEDFDPEEDAETINKALTDFIKTMPDNIPIYDPIEYLGPIYTSAELEKSISEFESTQIEKALNRATTITSHIETDEMDDELLSSEVNKMMDNVAPVVIGAVGAIMTRIENPANQNASNEFDRIASQNNQPTRIDNPVGRVRVRFGYDFITRIRGAPTAPMNHPPKQFQHAVAE